MKPVMKPTLRNGFKKQTAGSQEYNGHSEGVHTIALGVCSIPAVKRAVTATNYDSPWFLLSMAILRKILKRHYGVNVTHADQYFDMLVPPVYQTQGLLLVENTPRLVNITFYYKVVTDNGIISYSDAFTQTMPTTLAAADARTIGAVAATLATNLRDQFGYNYSQTVAGGTSKLSETNPRELYGYSICEMISMSGPDGTQSLNDPTNRVQSPVLRLDNMIVNMKFTTKIRIQNISPAQYRGSGVAADATAYDGADALEHNPLVGKLYHFGDPYAQVSPKILRVAHNNGAPGITSMTDMSVFGKDTTADGIVRVQGGGDLYALRHIPTPDMFMNCRGYSLVKLMPGEMKTHKQKFVFNGFINKLINGLTYTATYSGATGWSGAYRDGSSNGFGTFDLFCLEDYNGAHQGGTTDPTIRISYQVNRFGSCAIVKQVQEGMELMRNYTTPVLTIGEDV